MMGMPGPDLTPERARLVQEINEALFHFVWRYRQLAAQRFAPLGLTLPRAMVLGLIERDGLRHPSAIAESLELAPPAVSHLLTELEERRIITRSLDPDDRRRVRLELTDEGREVLEKATDVWHGLNAGNLGALTDAEAQTLRDLLRRVTEPA